MNAAIVPISPASNLAVVPTPAANTTAPPSDPPAPILKGRSFESVYQDVQQRADDMLSDQVVHVADLRMTPEGHVELPGGMRYRLNEWARKQLGSMLGVPRSQCHTARD